MSRQLELEEQALEEAYNNGEMSLQEFNKEMNELQRDFRAAAHEAAQDAYGAELDRW